ncbi:hypothetical protein FEM48_Zijuj09G0213100 [Ziziphus jujuba var. spinosa]|uniref:Uncharacterized protein n=1 Tax=Ziziphus jujuba var. spinosa TaxID=714518 RepID=A0A978UVD1_ZIZJJ|nr:hypothetical protein FEM48_Zijuj09G0213100 [Ziziphus jujuba var. spinosa]
MAKRFLNAISKSTYKQSLTVSYLVKSCGLSLEQALTAYKKVKIEDTKRPDSVFEMFSCYGFAESQVSRLICLRPTLILADPDVILRPKIKFLKTNDNVVRALKHPSCVARYSIEKVMMPNITTLLVHGVPQCRIARLMMLQPQPLR